MKFKKFDKRYLPMLWVGLAAWGLGWGMASLLEILGVEISGQETLMDSAKWLFQQSHGFALFLLCGIVPFLEECAFRLWAVGKSWATTVCLAGMVLFGVGEIGLWGILAVVAMILVPRLTKDEFLSNWIRAIISALCFAACHISGFNGLSWGMVFGISDIFGLALVQCWLVLNMGFWYSVLLHALNNTLAFLLPMLFLASPVANNGDEFSTEISALKPLAANAQLLESAANPYYIDSTTKEFYLVGEPAEIAYHLFNQCNNSVGVFFDWEPECINLDDRVKYQVTRHSEGEVDMNQLLAIYCKDVEQFRGKPFLFDTTRVMTKTVWLVYADGHEESIDETTNQHNAFSRLHKDINGKAIEFCEPVFEEDGSISTLTTYILPKAHPKQTQERITKLQSSLDKIYGFRLEYRDDHEVTLITIK